MSLRWSRRPGGAWAGAGLSLCLGAAVALLVGATASPASARDFASLFRGAARDRALIVSPDPVARREAAARLGRYGDARAAVSALATALPDEKDPSVRRAIVDSLARRGDPEAVPALIEALGTGLEESRRRAALALGAIPVEASLRALVAALGDPKLGAVAERSLERALPGAVIHLVAALDDGAARAGVARLLGRAGSSFPLSELLPLLRDPDEAVRRAAVEALGRIGDVRASEAIFALLEDSSPKVARAAAEALARSGAPEQVRTLASRPPPSDPNLRHAVLRALLDVDPDRGAAVLRNALGASPRPAERLIALALGSTHPALVPVLLDLAEEDERADEVFVALARIEDGRGVSELVGRLRPEPMPALERALAVGLRHHPKHVSSTEREAALAHLRAHAGPPARGLLLRAIARDEAVRAPLVSALRSGDPSLRAVAALGLAAVGEPAARGDLAAALLVERDPEAFRRVASALSELGGSAPLAFLERFLDDPERAPEALVLGATSLRTERSLHASRAFREGMRRKLRDRDIRVRAAACRALALAGERAAHRALAVALEDEAAEVRRAAGFALARLAVSESASSLEARLRVEDDDGVRAMLHDALLRARGRRVRPLGTAGTEILSIRVVRAPASGPPGLPERGVPVEVILPDGRFLRMQTLATGELFLHGLPSGSADVRMLVAPTEALSSRRE